MRRRRRVDVASEIRDTWHPLNEVEHFLQWTIATTDASTPLPVCFRPTRSCDGPDRARDATRRGRAGRDGRASAGSERLISGRTRFAWFPVGRIMTPQLSTTPTDNDNRCPSTSAKQRQLEMHEIPISKTATLQVTLL